MNNRIFSILNLCLLYFCISFTGGCKEYPENQAKNSEANADMKLLLQELVSTSANKNAPDQYALNKELQDIQEEIAKLRNQSLEQYADISDEFETNIGDLAIRMKALEEELQPQGGLLEDVTNQLEKITQQEESLAALEQKLKGLEELDLEKHFELLKDLAEKEGELIKANYELENAAEKAQGLKDLLEQQKITISELQEKIATLGNADLSQHPQYQELQKKLQEVQSSLERSEKDYTKMKEWASSLEKENQELKENAGKYPVLPKSGAGEPEVMASDFKGIIRTTFLNEDNQEYSVLVQLETGELPQVGEVLFIIDEKNQLLCEFIATKIYPEDNQFGGQTQGANLSNPPVKDDQVMRILPASSAENG